VTTVVEPRPLADLEMDSVLAVEAAWERRSHGIKPQTIDEYLEAVATVHVRYAHRRRWLAQHEQGVAS
jgi:hypothetical protein